MQQSYSDNSQMGPGAMYESEASRLQREADSFTKKYEHEKKRLMILEDQYKQAVAELEAKKEHLKKVRPATAKVKKDTAKTKVLENQLDKHLKHFNNLQAENRTLRHQIDVMRKEQNNQDRVNRGYGKDIKVTNDKARKLNQTTFQGQRVSEETNNSILAIKAKHETEKADFEKRIKLMQDKLREKDETELGVTKSHTANNAQEDTSSAAEFSNPIEIMKMRLAKHIGKNKEKKNLMDIYIRNVSIIEDAFNQIKQQTGIASTDEIVTTFIKTDDQNYTLYNYVNALNSEIDTVEDHNKNIEMEIKRHEELREMTDIQKEQCRERLRQDIEDNISMKNDKETQIQQIEGQMSDIKSHVWQMVEYFKKSHFFLSVASNMQYDEDTVFNEANVTLYLAELEEYISLFITYLAYKQENPDAPISSLSLDQMHVKDFEKNETKIDVPSTDVYQQMNEETDLEDDVITDPRDLYKRFDSQWEKQMNK